MAYVRRLAAIMFTDTVGYTASTHADEARALELIRLQGDLVRPIFAAHRGREIKSTGDGFLVEFESALQAALCAVEVQRRIHEHNTEGPAVAFQIRIGIHLGDVVEQGSDILGDAVNIASRIEPVAEPGGICVSGAVHQQVWNKIPEKLERLPPMTLKGLSGPMEVYRVALSWSDQDTVHPRPGVSGVAVLPFTNISPDPSDEYFADGLTEELIAVLSQVRDLRVISRTSVMLYKATPKSASQIAEELGVSSILEGSVRKAGSRLRVTAQLIDARSDRHIWASRYDRELDDVFAVQSEIAQRVAEALEVELRPTERARLEGRAPVRSESYLAYLKGRTLMHQVNEVDHRAAKEQFDLAISLDPRNAAANSGLSDLIRLVWYQLGMSREEAQETGRRLAERALKLDPDLAEAHASTAFTLWLRYDFEGAEREFQRALALNPSYSHAHHWYAELLSWQLRTDEALREWELAEGSDPLSPFNLSHYAHLLTWLGRYDEALVKIRKLGVLQPNSLEYHQDLQKVYQLRSDLELSRKEIRRIEELEPDAASKREWRAVYDLISGEVEKCVAALREEEAKSVPDFSPMSFVWFYARLGDLDACFRWLDTASQDPPLPFHVLRLDPDYEPVRNDARFRAHLERANLS